MEVLVSGKKYPEVGIRKIYHTRSMRITKSPLVFLDTSCLGQVGPSGFLEEGGYAEGDLGNGGYFFISFFFAIFHFLEVIIGRRVIYDLFCTGVGLYHVFWFSFL